MDSQKNIIDDLKKELYQIYEQGKSYGYYARIFKQALDSDDFLEKIKKFIGNRDKTPSGFSRVVKEERPDLTIEYVVTKEKYRELFSDEIIRICNERLGRK